MCEERAGPAGPLVTQRKTQNNTQNWTVAAGTWHTGNLPSGDDADGTMNEELQLCPQAEGRQECLAVPEPE